MREKEKNTTNELTNKKKLILMRSNRKLQNHLRKLCCECAIDTETVVGVPMAVVRVIFAQSE